MRPVFQIIADGEDMTRIVRDRLLSLGLTDESGWSSDRLELELDGRGEASFFSLAGSELEIALGYEEERSLEEFGKFVIDEFEFSAPPRRIRVRGHALAKDNLQQERTWDKVSLGEIGEKLASDHGLSASIESSAYNDSNRVWLQSGESDWSFLQRIAQSGGYILKVMPDRLALVKRNSGHASSGMSLSALELREGDVTSWSWSSRGQERRYGKVAAVWGDMDDGVDKEIEVGGEGEAYKMRRRFPNESEAREGALSRLVLLKSGRSSLRLSMAGRKGLFAGRPVRLLGVLGEIEATDWKILKVEHRLSLEGWRVDLDLEDSAYS